MRTAQIAIHQPTVLERFKLFYADLTRINLDELDTIYSPNVFFRDPVHQINGIEDLHSYMMTMCATLNEGRFEYLDEISTTGRAYIKWNMHFSHPRLGSKRISVRGVSHIHFSDRITFHEDIYDVGEMLYDHLPIMGKATQWLKTRLATRRQ